MATQNLGSFSKRRRYIKDAKARAKAAGKAKQIQAKATGKAAITRAKAENKATKSSKATRRHQRDVKVLESQHKTAQTVAKGTAAAAAVGAYGSSSAQQSAENQAKYEAYLATLNQPVTIKTGLYEGVE